MGRASPGRLRGLLLRELPRRESRGRRSGCSPARKGPAHGSAALGRSRRSGVAVVGQRVAVVACVAREPAIPTMALLSARTSPSWGCSWTVRRMCTTCFFSNREMVDFFKGLARHLRLGHSYFVLVSKIHDYKRERPIRIAIHKFVYNNFRVIVALLSIASVLVGIFKTLMSLKQHQP
ncbi:hypothetical protein ACQ4PT_008225 [Festuca glaucescens]